MLDDQTIGMAQARFHPRDLHGLFYLRRCLPRGLSGHVGFAAGKGCGCLALFKVSQGLYRLRSVFPGMPVGYHCDEESAKKHNR